MTRSDRYRRFTRRGYHHGNLKEALVSAAKQLIIEKGPHGFSLVETARLAGVSPAAPYRHFPDRLDLLREVAQRGFTQFADRLESAWENGVREPQAALRRLGQAYIQFACEERAAYAAMFMAGLDQENSPALKAESDRAFSALYNAVSELNPPSDEARTVSHHIWALSHGIATLFAQKPPTSQNTTPDPMELLDAGVRLYLAGLQLSAAKPSLAPSSS
ncbi:MAG: TetR/AcrR family transcriptional regulator [Methyloligellaceae bacterium]